MTVNEQDQLEFAAFVGIDWADRQHAWALRKVGSSILEEGQMAHIGIELPHLDGRRRLLWSWNRHLDGRFEIFLEAGGSD